MKGELGENLTKEYEDIEYVICQFEWYLLPLGIQRILTTNIINAQQSVTIECFGSSSIDRESFQKVSSALIKKKVEKMEVVSIFKKMFGFHLI